MSTSTKDNQQDEQLVTVTSSRPLPGDRSVMAEWAGRLVEQARTDGVNLTGAGGLLTEMVGQVLQTGLEAELTDHLGYERHDRAGDGSGNSRNGHYTKTVKTEIGEVPIRVPRDRNATFEPLTVPKGKRRFDGLAAQIISLYAKGLTTGDIVEHLDEIFDISMSRDTVSRIIDQIRDDMEAWRNRPLDVLYPVILIDAIVVKVRDGNVANRPIYVAMGVNMAGDRDVLGLWAGPTGNGEGAKYWAQVMADLSNRGIRDCFVVCCDGLKGLPDAIRATWPQADVQLCVVHLVRSSLRYTARGDWSKVCAGLRKIYTAANLNAAEIEFEVFRQQWETKYPAMINVWTNAWAEFIAFLDLPTEVRQLVYTTDEIVKCGC